MNMGPPPELLERLGDPDQRGSWYVWVVPGGESVDVWVWRPGMTHAVNRRTRSRIALRSPGRRIIESQLPEMTDPARWRLPSGDRRDYLLARGLREEEIAAYCVEDPDLPDWVIFPVEEDGKTVFWHARHLGLPSEGPGFAQETRSKYLSPRGGSGWIASHKAVWGLDRISPGEQVNLCEGIFDALAFPRGVAMLGPFLHEDQVVRILDRKPGRLLLCPDRRGDTGDVDWNQTQGWRRTVNKLSKIEVFVVVPPPGLKDWGETLPGRGT
jgi:hypothetical protein